MTTKIALVVDDTPANLDFLERLLLMANFDVRGASTYKQAMEQIADIDDLALAVVDIQLPDSNGLRLTEDLRKKYPDSYLVVATMYDERSLVERVFNRGGNVYLVKPHGFMELYKRLTTHDLEKLRKDDHLMIDQYGPRVISSASQET
ncbi:MAG: response regulator [Aggregatilineales bacterium]